MAIQNNKRERNNNFRIKETNTERHRLRGTDCIASCFQTKNLAVCISFEVESNPVSDNLIFKAMIPTEKSSQGQLRGAYKSTMKTATSICNQLFAVDITPILQALANNCPLP